MDKKWCENDLLDIVLFTQIILNCLRSDFNLKLLSKESLVKDTDRFLR